MPSKLEEVRAKIIEAIPEIMELKFGCRINVKKGKTSYSRSDKTGMGTVIQSFIGKKESWSGYDESEDRISAVLDNGTIRPKFGVSKNAVEIIGRPIRLSDVLMAIEKKEFMGFADLKWNLSADDLSLQSEETIAFIHSLLNK